MLQAKWVELIEKEEEMKSVEMEMGKRNLPMPMDVSNIYVM